MLQSFTAVAMANYQPIMTGTTEAHQSTAGKVPHELEAVATSTQLEDLGYQTTEVVKRTFEATT